MFWVLALAGLVAVIHPGVPVLRCRIWYSSMVVSLEGSCQFTRIDVVVSASTVGASGFDGGVGFRMIVVLAELGAPTV